MTNDIGRFSSSDTETPADPPAEEQKPAQLVYGSAEEFLHEQLLPTYVRDVDGRAAKWCIEWYYHPEAVTRVEALWRAWEHLRLDGATGISVWFKDHADHHMSVLLDPRDATCKSTATPNTWNQRRHRRAGCPMYVYRYVRTRHYPASGLALEATECLLAPPSMPADGPTNKLSMPSPIVLIMTFTYTSADLAKIAASIPSLASEAGLVIIPGVEIKKDIDVQVDSHEAAISDTLRVAVLVKAPFVSVESDPFSTEMLRRTEGYEELPPAAERLMESAEKHNGSWMSVTVTWVADGLAYQWMAQSDWIGPLLMELDAAVEEAEAEAEAADETETEEYREEYRVNYQASLSALLNSAKYRGESIGKRRHVVSSILADAGIEDMPDVFIIRQVMPDANRIIGEKVYEFEQDFGARIVELATELRAHPEWQRVYTKIKRKAAAAKFLMEKTDGYRLSNDLIEEISEAAANPVYVSRY